jgi:hypothetical protein
MHKPALTFAVLVALIVATNSAIGQSDKAGCIPLRNGAFFYYPKNSHDKYVSKRDGAYQNEKNLHTGDTAVYKVEWLSDCKYSLKLISCSVKMSAGEKDFWENHKLVYDITSVAKNYYTFNGYADKSSNLVLGTDTMWMTEKINTTSNELIEPVKNETALKKSHFTDTSKYAVLYLYRTGKFAASQVDMLVYFDNNLICDSKNNSAFIFKILKEGNFELSSVSNMNKKSAVLPLSIKFGQKYYVNSSAKFTVNMSSTYIPTLKLVDAEKGAEEFQNAY